MLNSSVCRVSKFRSLAEFSHLPAKIHILTARYVLIKGTIQREQTTICIQQGDLEVSKLQCSAKFCRRQIPYLFLLTYQTILGVFEPVPVSFKAIFMSSSTNFYSSEPAFPVLAYSLLSQSMPRTGNQVLQMEPASKLSEADGNRSCSWDLKRDLKKGFQCSMDTVFRCGAVVGLSSLRERVRRDDGESVGQVRSFLCLMPFFPFGLSFREPFYPSFHSLFFCSILCFLGFVGLLHLQLARYLVTTQLHQDPPFPSKQANAFIIHPPNFGPFAPETLLESLLSSTRQPTLSREEAIQRLDSVQLLPVFDFPSAAQAISSVSDMLHGIQRERNQALDHDVVTSPTDHPVLFIIAGLDSLAEGVIRASNPVKGTAMLTAVLRTLTRLTRTHASFLSVVLINTSPLGAVVGSSNLQRDSQQPVAQSEGDFQSRDEGIQSIFHGAGRSLFPNLLMRTLDQGIDTHLLLSTVQRAQIVEVIKDRVGDGTGKWCVWDEVTN